MKKNANILTMIVLCLIIILFINVRNQKIHKKDIDSLIAIKNTYGTNDLSKSPPFQGGYINFGYWKNIEIEGQITEEQRIRASFDLYKLIIDKLDLKANEHVLEVGCGLGNGGRYVASIYNPQLMTCIDSVDEQIMRAKALHTLESEKYNNLEYIVSPADNVDKASGAYDKIYSVEVAQYFPSMEKFANEAFRLLKHNGKIIVTAHFSTSKKGYERAKQLIPTVSQNIDRMIPIKEVQNAFIRAGFKEVKVESIGEHVFGGFDQWISQVEDVDWAHNINKLYQENSIDYYVITLIKS